MEIRLRGGSFISWGTRDGEDRTRLGEIVLCSIPKVSDYNGKEWINQVALLRLLS